MGCDLHNKTYLWSKVENRYVDAFDLMIAYDIEKASTVWDLVPDREYDIYSAFGRPMMNCPEFGQPYPEMGRFKVGIPNLLVGTTFGKLVGSSGSGNFGYRWWLLPDLKAEIPRYVEILRDPELFFEDKENECYLDYKAGMFTRERFEEFNRDAISGMERVLERISSIETILSSDTGSWTRDEISEAIEPEKTVFFFWFNS